MLCQSMSEVSASLSNVYLEASVTRYGVNNQRTSTTVPTEGAPSVGTVVLVLWDVPACGGG